MLQMDARAESAWVPARWTRFGLQSGLRRAVVLGGAPCPARPAEEVLGAACRLARAEGLVVSVAAPGALAALPRVLRAAVERSGVAANRLELVVTPGQLVEAGAGSALSLVRALGAGVALRSDIGAGLMQRAPVSSVIVSAALGCGRVAVVVEAAQRLDVSVVATGIATEGRRALLSGLGCADGEGELFDPAFGWPG